MRDKVLCKGWAGYDQPNAKAFRSSREEYFSTLLGFSILCLLDSVPVSIQGGVKMSIDDILSFFDHNAAQRDQKTLKYEMGSRQELDTILMAESLFRGTVLDFHLDSHSGGWNYAGSSTAS